jgi:hypothetical protein
VPKCDSRLKFFIQEHGQAGVNTLAHLGMVSDDRHRLIASNVHQLKDPKQNGGRSLEQQLAAIGHNDAQFVSLDPQSSRVNCALLALFLARPLYLAIAGAGPRD